MPIGHNRVLGDAKLASENRPHRLAMANWPASVKDPRTETLDAYLNFLAVNGYQGTEFGIGSFARYFPGQSHAAIASQVRRRLEQAGLQNFGATLHTGDDAMRALGWLTGQKDQMKLIQDTGGEFVSYQINLHPGYLHTGGAYREDEEYLKFCADRASELRAAAWEQGMNFYLEVHVDRITDDPAATCRILQLATCELNGDLSHLLSRGITQGKYVDTMLKHMGHTHVRMSRSGRRLG